MWKFRNRVSRCWGIAKRDTLSPIFDKSQFFNLLTIPILLLLSSMVGDAVEEVTSLSKTFLAIAMTLPIWFLINLVLSPLRAIKEEKDEGTWNGNKFTFNMPEHVATFSFSSSENGKRIRFQSKKLAPNSLANFKIVYDGGNGFIKLSNHENTEMPGDRDTQYSVNLNKKSEAVIEVCIPSDSRDTTATIYMLSFEKDDNTILKIHNFQGTDLHVTR